LSEFGKSDRQVFETGQPRYCFSKRKKEISKRKKEISKRKKEISKRNFHRLLAARLG